MNKVNGSEKNKGGTQVMHYLDVTLNIISILIVMVIPMPMQLYFHTQRVWKFCFHNYRKLRDQIKTMLPEETLDVKWDRRTLKGPFTAGMTQKTQLFVHAQCLSTPNPLHQLSILLLPASCSCQEVHRGPSVGVFSQLPTCVCISLSQSWE